jgi:hypothetical protein
MRSVPKWSNSVILQVAYFDAAIPGTLPVLNARYNDNILNFFSLCFNFFHANLFYVCFDF